VIDDAQSELALQALGSIETTGRQGLVELRGLLGVLYRDPETEGPATRAGLERLPALVAQLGSAGLPVELVVSGQARPLPAEVEWGAYRIVQEALTNAPQACRPDAGDRSAVLPAGGAGGPGAGREKRQRPRRGRRAGNRRHAAPRGPAGWEMAAGPRPEGGFQVTVTLPVDGEGP
jgi:hypothetical protein